MNKYLKMLEFDKIIELLKKEVVLKVNHSRLENITLMDEIEDIELSLNEVDEAVILQQRMGRNPIYFNVDLKAILVKIHKNGIINEGEL